jgi:hypothetical protein
MAKMQLFLGFFCENFAWVFLAQNMAYFVTTFWLYQ